MQPIVRADPERMGYGMKIGMRILLSTIIIVLYYRKLLLPRATDSKYQKSYSTRRSIMTAVWICIMKFCFRNLPGSHPIDYVDIGLPDSRSGFPGY